MQYLYQPHLLSIFFWLTIYGTGIIELWTGRKHKPEYRSDIGRKSDILLVLSIAVGMWIAFSLKGARPNLTIYNNEIIFWLSLILIWSGVALRHKAITTLGKYHVMTIATQDGQPVIKNGPYRYIRHPSYLGGILAITGIALALNGLPGAIILITLTVVALVHRIIVEEHYLSKHLGQPYKDYMADTNRLIPYLW